MILKYHGLPIGLIVADRHCTIDGYILGKVCRKMAATQNSTSLQRVVRVMRVEVRENKKIRKQYMGVHTSFVYNSKYICFSVSIIVDERRSYERERMQERKKEEIKKNISPLAAVTRRTASTNERKRNLEKRKEQGQAILK